MRFNLVDLRKDRKLFELLRIKCLGDVSNKLRRNYFPDRLDANLHDTFDALFDQSCKRFVAFAGLFNGGRYPEQVARAANRSYVFPEYRSIENARSKRPWIMSRIVPFQIQNNPEKRKLIFISMEERPGPCTVDEHPLFRALPVGWKVFPDLVRVVNGDNPSCFQRVIYTSLDPNFSFFDWNPETITLRQWKAKFLLS